MDFQSFKKKIFFNANADRKGKVRIRNERNPQQVGARENERSNGEAKDNKSN